MPKGLNASKTKIITVSVAPEIHELLERIAKSGYSARSVAAVAEEMIRKGLDGLDANGILGKLLHQRITVPDETR
jgi:hypothetical protein